MQTDNKNLFSSFFWSALQRFGTRIWIFLSNLVLARLLSPSDFGYSGIILVFTEFCNIFINGGFASSLIQKKNPTQTDYSSVFFINLIMSVLLFIIFFWGATHIANLYQSPFLRDILRVQGIVLIFNAFNVVQINIRQKNLDFKQLAIAENIACIISCLTGILSALNGFGVWSFVVKNLCQSMIYSIILWFWDSWKPSLILSLKSIRELFNFGGFILLSSLVDAVYGKMQPLLIGKVFSEVDLGYFTQGRKLQDNPTMSLTHMLSAVSYPLYSKLQDNKIELLTMLRRNIKASTYICFPLMVMLIVIAEPLIIILFGEKWLPSVPFFQILCIEGLVATINVSNKDMFMALGMSRMYFRVQVAYEIVGIALILYGMNYGLIGFVWGRVAAFYALFIFNAILAHRIIGYKVWTQIYDILPNLLISMLAGMAAFVVSSYIYHLGVVTQTLCISIIYVSIYLMLSALSRNISFLLFWRIILGYIKRI